jgi:hypothetical protein
LLDPVLAPVRLGALLLAVAHESTLTNRRTYLALRHGA